MQLLSLVQNNSSFKQTALDPGKGSRRPRPSLLLDQTEDRRAEKIWGRHHPPALRVWLAGGGGINHPPYLRVWMTAPPPPPPPPYLMVWVRPWRMRILCVLQM